VDEIVTVRGTVPDVGSEVLAGAVQVMPKLLGSATPEALTTAQTVVEPVWFVFAICKDVPD